MIDLLLDGIVYVVSRFFGECYADKVTKYFESIGHRELELIYTFTFMLCMVGVTTIMLVVFYWFFYG